MNRNELINIDRLFNNKLYADAEDFAREFGCSKGKGYKLIRSIKSISDIAGLSGKVTKTDFLVWSFLPFKNKGKGGMRLKESKKMLLSAERRNLNT